ncbi:MAG: hypothetical protein ABFD24_06085 [Anaerolineaceae bacterium]
MITSTGLSLIFSLLELATCRPLEFPICTGSTAASVQITFEVTPRPSVDIKVSAIATLAIITLAKPGAHLAHPFRQGDLCLVFFQPLIE